MSTYKKIEKIIVEIDASDIDGYKEEIDIKDSEVEKSTEKLDNIETEKGATKVKKAEDKKKTKKENSEELVLKMNDVIQKFDPDLEFYASKSSYNKVSVGFNISESERPYKAKEMFEYVSHNLPDDVDVVQHSSNPHAIVISQPGSTNLYYKVVKKSGLQQANERTEFDESYPVWKAYEIMGTPLSKEQTSELLGVSLEEIQTFTKDNKDLKHLDPQAELFAKILENKKEFRPHRVGIYDEIREHAKSISGITYPDKWNPGDVFFMSNVPDFKSTTTIEELNNMFHASTDLFKSVSDKNTIISISQKKSEKSQFGKFISYFKIDDFDSKFSHYSQGAFMKAVDEFIKTGNNKEDLFITSDVKRFRELFEMYLSDVESLASSDDSITIENMTRYVPGDDKIVFLSKVYILYLLRSMLARGGSEFIVKIISYGLSMGADKCPYYKTVGDKLEYVNIPRIKEVELDGKVEVKFSKGAAIYLTVPLVATYSEDSKTKRINVVAQLKTSGASSANKGKSVAAEISKKEDVE